MCTPHFGHSSMQYTKEMGNNELNKYLWLQKYISQGTPCVPCFDICVLSFSNKQDCLVSDLCMVTCTYSCVLFKVTVFFKTKGHPSRLAWPTQRDGLSCLASPRLALRCAAWPGKTNPNPCSRSLVTSGCSHRYYNSIVHNAKCINIPFFSVRQVVFLCKKECIK